MQKKAPLLGVAAATNAPPAALFDYSEQQWKAIKAAVQPVWNGALPKDARDELVQIARWYLAEQLGVKARQEQ